MGFVARLFEKRDANLTPSRSGLGALLTMGNHTSSGVHVTYEKAMTVSAVFACIRILAESVASLPLITYERHGDRRGKDRATDHHLYELLKEQPNPEMTSFEWREFSMQHLAARGNAYSEIEYDRAGRVRGLWPLNPANMEVRRENRQIIYRYSLPDGGIREFPSWKIHHIRSMGNGIVGYSVITLARQAIGYAIATEMQDAAFYSNGAVPGVILKHPGTLSDQAHARLVQSWDAKHKGLDNAYRTAILEEGLDLDTVGLSKDDNQFIETREFQVNDVARWFRIPPHMVGDLRRATFSNIEQQSLDFLIHTLRPWLVRIEQAARRDLIAPDEQSSIVVEHLVDGLLRGDTETRYASYSEGRNAGWLSVNEIREMENRNPIEGGDEYLVPLNMIPAGQAGAEPDATGDEDGDTNDNNLRYLDLGEHRAGDECGCSTHAEQRAYEIREDDEPENVRRIRTARQRLARSYVGLFEEVAARVVRRETNDVRGAIQKHLRKRSLDDFLGWVTEFYRDWDEVVIEAFRALMLTFADQVLGAVADELDEDEDGLTDELREFIEGYLAAFGAAWAASSRRQIESLASGKDDEEIAELIEERLDGWRETQAAKVGLRQAFEGVNALAFAIYGTYEVVRYLWAASGDSCPFCQSLSGTVIGRDEFFVEAGSEIDAGDGSTPLLVRRNARHGPLHRECDCIVMAG